MNKENFQKSNSKFDKLYNQVYSETHEKLESALNPFKAKIKIIIYFFLIIDLFMLTVNPPIVFLSIPIIIVIIIMMYRKNTKEYRHLYKTEVLQRFIQLYNKNLNYIPDKGIPYSEYSKAEFEKCDKYYYGDLIYGKLDGYDIKMAKVITEQINTSSNEEIKYNQMFHGLFTISTFENKFDGFIKVRSDRGNLLNTFHKKNKLEMDSQEFEKYFDVISTNKLQTMQVLTSDIMNMLIKFEQEYNIKVELTIKEQKIFIRFHYKSFFNSPIFSLLDYNTLLRDYNLINFTFDISRALIKSTAETKI